MRAVRAAFSGATVEKSGTEIRICITDVERDLFRPVLHGRGRRGTASLPFGCDFKCRAILLEMDSTVNLSVAPPN